jgi:hypothetical protein
VFPESCYELVDAVFAAGGFPRLNLALIFPQFRSLVAAGGSGFRFRLTFAFIFPQFLSLLHAAFSYCFYSSCFALRKSVGSKFRADWETFALPKIRVRSFFARRENSLGIEFSLRMRIGT